MTTRKDQFKRLKWTLILFGVSLLAVGASFLTQSSTNQHTDERVNAIVCVTRPYILASRARAAFNMKNGKTATLRAQGSQAVDSADLFLAGLITTPRHFNCKPYLNKLLKEAQHDEH